MRNELPLLKSASTAQARFEVRRRLDGRISHASFYVFDNSLSDIMSRAIADAMQALHIVRPRQDEFWYSEDDEQYRMEPPVNGTLQDLIEKGNPTAEQIDQIVRLVYGIVNRVVTYGPRPYGRASHHVFHLLDARPLQFTYGIDERGKMDVWLATAENVVARCVTQPRDDLTAASERVQELIWDYFIGGCLMILVGTTSIQEIPDDHPRAASIRELLESVSAHSKILDAANAYTNIETQLRNAIPEQIPSENYIQCLATKGYRAANHSLMKAPSSDHHASLSLELSSGADRFLATFYENVDDDHAACIESTMRDVYSDETTAALMFSDDVKVVRCAEEKAV